MTKITKQGPLNMKTLSSEEALRLIGSSIAVTCRELFELDPNEWYSVYLEKLNVIAGANEMLMAVMEEMRACDIDFRVEVPYDLQLISIKNPYHKEDIETPSANAEGDSDNFGGISPSLDDFPF